MSSPTAGEPSSAIHDHAIWTDEGVMGPEDRGALLELVDRQRPTGLVTLLDLLNEALSPVAEGHHRDALMAYLETPRRPGRHLRRWIRKTREEIRRARTRDDTDELLQLQTRASVITAELARRRPELAGRSTRSRALEDLRSLCDLASTSVWQRHVLNWRLRGPMQLGTKEGRRIVRRFYRRNDHETFASADRRRYLDLLAEIEGGGLDAFNGYDWGGVSLGIAQFTASGPYLGELMRRIREAEAEAFEDHFARRGLDVGDDGMVRINGRPLIEAIPEMTRQVEFHPVLLAFTDLLEVRKLKRSLFRHQVALADELVDRAMALEAGDGTRLSEALGTSRGQAHLADAFINTGADDTLQAFAAARREASPGTLSLVEAFVRQRRRFYRSTGQGYQLRRIEAIDTAFGGAQGGS